jgi:DNA polymerase-3 subunit delta
VIYLLYGTDEVAREEFLQRKLIARLRALPGGEFNLDRFDGRSAPISAIIACCQAAPFLAEKRMVIVQGLSARAKAARGTAAEEAGGSRPRGRGARGTDDELGELWAFLPHLPASTHLVLVDERPLPLPPLPPGMVYRQEFEAPKPWKLAEWIAARARARKVRLDRGVAESLATLVGPDLRRLDQELAKLAVYCGAQPVREADVRLLVAPSETTVFALLDSVAEGRPGAALAALRRLRQQGQAVEALLPQLAALVRRLLTVRALQAEGQSLAETAQAYGLTTNPRALEKLARQAARFDERELERAYDALLACDRAIKRGECDAETAVELLVAELAGVPSGA